MQLNWQKLKDKNFKDNFKKRARIIRLIREFFYQQGFLEVDTPQLVKLPGMEPNLTPFKTELIGFKGEKQPAYLITSPEYAMKKLLCGGLPKIWQITSSFRNAEDNSPMHNPEFKILEWYRANADYNDIAKDTENLVYFINKKINKSRYLISGGKKIDLKTPWTRLTIKDAFKKYLDIDLVKFIEETPDWQTEFYKLFLTHIEPKLGWDKPVILMDYPAQMASLSKIKKDDPLFAERFEVYIAGLELANAFSELNDASEQEARLRAERAERIKDGKEDYAVDETFINALKYGMPASGGIALGVDRLIMLLIGVKSLSEVILFPATDVF